MKLTPWFSRRDKPVRDGLYLARYSYTGAAGDCWFVLRWDAITCGWYSAGTTGRETEDVIGGGLPNLSYEWRGLTEPTA